MPDPTTPWTRRYNEVIDFMVVLWKADRLSTSEEDITPLVEYLQHPGQWEPEHFSWESFGSPQPETDAENWEAWIDGLSEEPEIDEDE